MSNKAEIRRAGRIPTLPTFERRMGSNGRKNRNNIMKPKRRFMGRHGIQRGR